MRITYEWLRDFVDVAASPEEMAHRLTMIGLEIEGTADAGGEAVMELSASPHRTVFEVNVTPNRPDCLSVIGIARELSAAYRLPLKIPPCEIAGKQTSPDFSVGIMNPELCNRYAGRLITGVGIGASPGWIREKLEKCGMRSINNVVDITNYVLLEFGHPLHAFDADTLKGKKILIGTPETVKGKGIQTIMKTLDGIERVIPGDSLLIWDIENPVAVAGVMGGSDTEVTEKTKNIFIESAYFDPVSVRRTSKKLGLVSEASYRFERGTDIEFLEKALDRAALMIREIAGGTIHEIIDEYPVKYMKQPVAARFESINKHLGTALEQSEMLEILKRLSIPAEKKDDAFVVYPPAHRRDITRENDVAEEIARIYGYDSIPTTVPKSSLSSGHLNKRRMHLTRIREAIRKTGFTEVINFSFMGKSSLDIINIPESDSRRKAISIGNPLSQDGCLLRTTLAPALIENLKYNIDRGIKDIRIFETAKVFLDTGESLPAEELRLGGIFYREKSQALWKEDTRGFFLAKGALESMLEELKIRGYLFSPSSEPFFHAGQASDIYVSDSRIGYLGVLGPDVVEKLALKKQKPEIALFEIRLDPLLKFIPDSIQYSPVPRYPSVERDIAIVIDETIPSSLVRELISSFPTDLIEEVSVFDCFQGGNIPSGKKSLAYNFVYRSRNRTLRDEEVDSLHESLLKYVLEKTGGELRK